MAQTMHSQSFESFVNPAELCSLPLQYEQETAMPESLGGLRIDTGVPLVQLYNTWKADQLELLRTAPWLNSSPMSTPSSEISMQDYLVSSPSSSNSPPSSVLVQQGQSHKRRAQNRAAQRAYRDRKMRYLQDLESGIKDIERKIRLLQSENTDLIRELCDMRAANNDLRSSQCAASDSLSSSRIQATSSSLESTMLPSRPRPVNMDSRSSQSRSKSLSNVDDSLLEPFEAMWNLIQLDPAVVKGAVSPATILERLRGMVEINGKGKLSAPAPRSYSLSDIVEEPALQRLVAECAISAG